MNYNPEKPVVVGICGKAGTGKTSVGDRLAPPAMFIDPKSGFVWDHLFLAMPLYELAAIRRKVQGENRKDRILFETHEVLFDLFGRSPLYGLPPYEEFVTFVARVVDEPIEYDEDVKPRSFLQNVGSLCREVDENCFIKNTQRTMIQHFLRYAEAEDTEDCTYVCVVSDVRQPNEAEWVRNQENGILLRFDASDAVRAERILDRDGVTLTQEQLNHHTEDIDKIDDNLIDAVINTDELTLSQQVEVTRSHISESLQLEVYA